MKLQLNLENINITEKFISKTNNLMIGPHKKNYQMPNKNYRTNHGLPKEILKSIKKKKKQYKKMCRTKDLTKHKKIEQEFIKTTYLN